MTPEMITSSSKEAVQKAANTLIQGGIAVIPTDTVYGMLADPNNEKAVGNIYRIKKREPSKPLAVFYSCTEHITELNPLLPLQVKKAAVRLLPGPLTYVIESLTGDKTGVRVPDHTFVSELTSLLHFPPAATSVNVSGDSPLCDPQMINKTFGTDIDLIVEEGVLDNPPSSVVEFGSQGITLLRQGETMLQEVIQAATVTVLFVCSGNICRSPAAALLLRSELEKKLSTTHISTFGFRILSGGTYKITGNTPPAEMTSLLHNRDGCDLSGYSSRPLTDSMIAEADIIFTMDHSHVEYISNNFPEATQKTHPLDVNGLDIEDPYQLSMEDYERTYKKIKQGIRENVLYMLFNKGTTV